MNPLASQTVVILMKGRLLLQPNPGVAHHLLRPKQAVAVSSQFEGWLRYPQTVSDFLIPRILHDLISLRLDSVMFPSFDEGQA